MIEGCSRFTYLTCKQKQSKSSEGKQDGAGVKGAQANQKDNQEVKVYLNLLIVDAYNRAPQVAHFKSKKIFDLRTKDEFEDVIKQNFIYKQGDEVHLMTQFPLAIHHSILRPDIDIDDNKNQQNDQQHGVLDQIEVEISDIQSNKSHLSNYKREINAFKQTEKYRQMIRLRELKKKKQEFQKKLKGDLIKVRMFQDVDLESQRIYFAVRNEATQNINIKSFDPSEPEYKQVRTILTLTKQNLLVFTQLQNGQFLIMDQSANTMIYEFNNGLLERVKNLYLHDYDKKLIAKKFRLYERFIVDEQILIARGRIFYFHEHQDEITSGILHSEELKRQIKSDYEFQLVNGPVRYIGQDQFINMYIYKDSLEEQVFYFRQIIYQKPNSCVKSLIHDFNNSTKMSTFLDNGQILAHYGNKFQNFTSKGNPIDEIEFQGHKTTTKGDQQYPYPVASVYLVVYWHDFRCQDDGGINKKTFMIMKDKDEKLGDQIDPEVFPQCILKEYHRENTTDHDCEMIAKAKAFYDKKEISGKSCILVMIDENSGFQYLKRSKRGNYNSQLIEAAKQDYFNRYELQTMSRNNDYFMFYDNFLCKYSIWELKDMTHQLITNTLKSSNSDCNIGKEINMISVNSQQVDMINGAVHNKVEFKPKPEDETKYKKKFPEIEHTPLHLNEVKKKIYITKYLQPLDLEDAKVMVNLSHDPQSWAHHSVLNILNNFKTKFNCVNVDISKKNKQKVEKHEQYFGISFDFPEPVQISGYGFRSANDFPHLDPAEIEIHVEIEQEKSKKVDDNVEIIKAQSLPQSDANKHVMTNMLRKGSKLEFQFRSQCKYFLKPAPWQKVKKVEFRIFENRAGFEKRADDKILLSFQLSEIIILQRRHKLDYRFQKVMDLNLWQIEKCKQNGKDVVLGKDNTEIFKYIEENQTEANNQKTYYNKIFKKRKVKEDLNGKSDNTKEFDEKDNIIKTITPDDKKEKYLTNFEQTLVKKLAFFNQQHVVKHIRVLYPDDSDEDEEASKDKKKVNQQDDKKYKEVQAIFAYVDQKESESSSNLLSNDKAYYFILGTGFKKQWICSKDSNEFVEQKAEIFNFAKQIEIDNKQLESERKQIQKDLRKLRVKNDRFIMQQMSLQKFQRDTKQIYKNQKKVRKQLFKFNQLITVKFGVENLVIKQSKIISSCNLEKLCDSFRMDKENTECNKSGDKQQPENKYKDIPTLSHDDHKQISLKFPSDNCEIIDMYGTGEVGVWQVFAKDNQSNILIIATWDLVKDQERSMYQFRCDDPQPQDLFMQAIAQDKETIKKKEEKKKLNKDEDQLQLHRGEFNYILEEDTVIDLENNIPFFFSDYNEKARLNKDIDITSQSYENVKKIFRDSSRFLSIYNHHHLIFSHTKRDTLLWKNIMAQENRAEVIESCALDILKAFRLQYQGMSLFHHFASNTEIMQLVYKEYIKIRDQDKFEEESVRRMPLFILCPEDEMDYVALGLCIKQQKPNNFEMMISMLQDFHEICSSKMMMGNLDQMITLGFGQVLEFFDKSTFNPPLMQTPFAVDWPEGLEEFPFASPTSLVTDDLINEQLKKAFPIRKVFKKLAEFQTKLEEKLHIFEQNQLSLKSTTQKQMRRVVVQALDFDWIFDKDNAEKFVILLDMKGAQQLYGQRSIKVFIQLMWRIYKPKLAWIMFHYCTYLGAFLIITSVDKFNPMERMKTIDENGEVLNERPDDIEYLTLVIFRLGIGLYCSINVILNISIELKQMHQIALEYFFQPWNIFDLVQSVLNTIYLVMQIQVYNYRFVGVTEEWKQTVRTVGSFAIFFMWIKMFYWMKLFEEPAFFITQLGEVLASVTGFTAMFAIVLIAFSNFFGVIQLNARDEVPEGVDEFYVMDIVGIRFVDAFVQMYLISLGEFSAFEGFSSGHDKNSAWIAFIVATVILQLLFMNMIIAIMSEKFVEINESRDLFKFKQQIDIINDYLWTIDLKKQFEKDKYILVVKPEEITIDEETGMQSYLTDKITDENKATKKLFRRLDQLVHRKLDQMKDNIDKQLTAIEKIEKDLDDKKEKEGNQLEKGNGKDKQKGNSK